MSGDSSQRQDGHRTALLPWTIMLFVVEDEPPLARLVASYLERDGFAVSVCEDGQHDHPHLQLDGTTWWFCSAACRDEFAANPDRFSQRPLEPQALSARRGPAMDPPAARDDDRQGPAPFRAVGRPIRVECGTFGPYRSGRNAACRPGQAV